MFGNRDVASALADWNQRESSYPARSSRRVYYATEDTTSVPLHIETISPAPVHSTNTPKRASSTSITNTSDVSFQVRLTVY